MIVVATDWTTVSTTAVAGLSGVAGAFLGYLGARLTARASREQKQAEIDLLKEEHRSKQQAERRAIYSTFLGEERAVYEKLEGGPVAPAKDIEEWLKALAAPLDDVMLSGPSPVARAAVDMHAVLLGMGEATIGWNENKTTIGEWQEAYDKWRPARQALVDAMRADVSADSAAVDWPAIRDRRVLDDLPF